ncbi:MAG: lamin tail domain-containing protein [Verrucomicrobiia bacterium]
MNDGFRKTLKWIELTGLAVLFLWVKTLYSVDLFYLPSEPLGPSSRNTGLVISEIMYNYGYRPDGRIIEYIEIYNTSPYPEDISGYKITGIIDYTFPSNTVIGSREYIILTRSATDLQAVYGLRTNVLSYGGVIYRTNVVSGITNIIQEQITISGTGTIQLKDRKGKLLLSVNFSNDEPWPVAADGTGHSLVLARPSYGENDYRAWTISDYRGGSPGRGENFSPETISPIVINEVCANPSSGEKFVEIYNRTPNSVDLTDYGLSDDPTKIKYKIPRTVHISGYGMYSFPASMLGFSPATMGETIYLFNPTGTRIFDAVKYTPHPVGMSWGRYPDGADGIFLLSRQTSGSSNARFYRSEVVINEIMYAPISGDSDDEFIELYNRGTNSINLGGWQIQGGVNFLFSTNTVIPPDGFIVVARNMTNLFEKYNRPDKLCCGKVVGNYAGSLNDRGERIVLAMPFTVVTLDQSGNYKTNKVTVPVDEVTYVPSGNWGKWSHNGGSSIELVDPHSNGREPMNWKDSINTTNTSWEWMISSLQLEKGRGPIDRIQIFLRDSGECLIDNVEVLLFPYSVNVVSNSDFETGLNGWQLNGNHSKSKLDINGYQGTKCLRIIADGQGDILGNNISGFLTAPLSPDSIITIRARVKWISGNTNLVIRLIGNYAEFRIGMHPSQLCGTPGEKNSRYIANAGPTISRVCHSPVLPRASDNVLIQAKIDDPDGISNVSLYYRIDPSTNYSIIPMTDNGLNGDKYAYDGIYTARLSAQPSNTIVAYFIAATDNSSNRITSFFPSPDSDYECLIRYGDEEIINSAFGNYYIWMTADNYNLFTNTTAESKKFFPVTFVYNNRIIYGAKIRYSGELCFDQNNNPLFNKYSYTISFPEDDLLLGYSLIEKLRVPGDMLNTDTTLIRNLCANIMAKYTDQPYYNVRLVRFKLNGVQEKSMLWEDVQEPNENYCAITFNSSVMHLFNALPWIEYKGNEMTNYSWAFLNYRTNNYGEQDPREYAVNWKLEYPYSIDTMYIDFYNLIKLLNSQYSINYDVILNEYVDLEEWAKYFAFQKFIGNPNYIGGKKSYNGYVLMTDKKKWILLQNSYNMSFYTNISMPNGDDLFYFNTDDVGVSNIFSIDTFKRLYKNELYYLASKIPSNITSIISSIASALNSENIITTDKEIIINWINIRSNYIITQYEPEINAEFKVNMPTLLYTNTYCILIEGTGPIAMKNILVNSNIQKVSWSTTTNWSFYLQLVPGTNIVSINGVDSNNYSLPGARFQATIITPLTTSITNYNDVYYIWNIKFKNIYQGLDVKTPVLINEIMYNSSGVGGDYIEIYNPNPNIFVDLSGIQVKGTGYTIPDGTILMPLGYLVIVENINVFKSNYGDSLPVIGQYSGNLNNIGEKLSLVITDKNTGKEMVLDEVRYEANSPFPIQANGLGSSLQLINPYEDNSRIANWMAIDPSINPGLPVATPGIKNSVIDTNLSIPKLFINEIQTRNITGITNSIGMRTGWIEILFNDTGNISLNNYYLSDNYDELLKWKFPDGTTAFSMKPLVIFADGIDNYESDELHASFSLATNSGTIFLSRLVDGKIQIIDYIKYDKLTPDTSYGSYPDGQCLYRQIFLEPSPGLLNKSPVRIFINEWMASNIAAYDDNVDNDFEDWFELYNMSYNDVDLSGYYLTDNLTNRNQFRIPDGTIIPGRGYLLVWADGEPWQNTIKNSEIHCNFTLSKNGESIGLFAPDLTLIDSVTFGQQYDNISQGRFPDGSTNIVFMNIVTPGFPNMVEGRVANIDPIPINPGGVVYLIINVSDVLTNFIRFEPGVGFPSDAFLDPNRGIFVWVSPTNQPLGDFKFFVKVCDLRPGASVIDVMFTIRVIPPINLNIQKNQQLKTVTLYWNSLTQQVYKIQYKTNLNDVNWTEFLPITSTSTTTTVVIPMTNQSGFFRIIGE